MKRYKNLAGDSGVTAYAFTDEGIVVEFRDGWRYAYTAASAGPEAIATMRRLAASGCGLSGFIATHVREAYARRFREGTASKRR